MASVVKNIEYIKKHFDTHSEFIIKKIEQSNISISRKSTEFVSKIAYPLSNYIDFVNNGTYTNLDKLSANDIIVLYNQWVMDISSKFSTTNYVETNEILFDYRVNGIGYYWVDLKSFYSWEMVFRLKNCGRVNSYQNFLELREYDNLKNYSRVVVVLNKSGRINQIRGYENEKPEKKYEKYIFDLFLNYKEIKGFNFLFNTSNDFTQFDIEKENLNILKEKRPELFNLEML